MGTCSRPGGGEGVLQTRAGSTRPQDTAPHVHRQQAKIRGAISFHLLREIQSSDRDLILCGVLIYCVFPEDTIKKKLHSWCGTVLTGRPLPG